MECCAVSGTQQTVRCSLLMGIELCELHQTQMREALWTQA